MEKNLYRFAGGEYLTVGEMKTILEDVSDDCMFLVSDGKDFFTVNEVVIDEENDLLVRALKSY